MNASWLADKGNGGFYLLAHRGVYQNYDRTNLAKDECTASRISKPTHTYIENTILAISKAFEYKADTVEIDIHPTKDGEFVVFHDWTLNCRTNGSGITREQTLKYLKTLDVGYNYTYDGGKNYPFRGMGVGLIPTLKQVIQAFPNKKFLINIKSNDPNEAVMLAKYLELEKKENADNLSFYGGDKPIAKLAEDYSWLKVFTKKQVKKCLKNYMLTGWTGVVTKACTNTTVLIPVNYAKFLWGWPNRFKERMDSVGTDYYLVGPYNPDMSTNGIPGFNAIEYIKELPEGYTGGIWTDKIELVSSHIKQVKFGFAALNNQTN
ncbi:glycerophosphodiester phosphodiesterase family protein [Spartinivicinus poritis]|uniref:Glycerophosphodiester phosphodiesterase family protein n=1 Tax=Spartinivicinus poritis TaxID=2994640 RepID=A0ABT5U877_9GAMM|nr:glycerophosphodiester phosphodiesterase family protein [Spartinivicinus sp. A2-2]MDE1462591.1 glycerophosphodiester phosphodiesterase family protein [Spartinivicinus sp. A2-2]